MLQDLSLSPIAEQSRSHAFGAQGRRSDFMMALDPRPSCRAWQLAELLHQAPNSGVAFGEPWGALGMRLVHEGCALSTKGVPTLGDH